MPPSRAPAPIEHAENFPVASWLCPPRWRAPIAAIYHFARTADDLADEGATSASERLAALAACRVALHEAARGSAATLERWPQVFDPLAAQMRAFDLPLAPLEALLSAFEQDVVMTRDASTHADMAALLDYCTRSANPVGRLLLHLYGLKDDAALRQSDAICSALQLINFWQDLSVDIPRGRYYLPLAACAAHGITITDPARQFAQLRPDAGTHALIADLAHHARGVMLAGAPLVHRVAGRAGWELRAVVQGGLRMLGHIEAMGAQVLHTRPHLGATDWPRIGWRMLRM